MPAVRPEAKELVASGAHELAKDFCGLRAFPRSHSGQRREKRRHDDFEHGRAVRRCIEQMAGNAADGGGKNGSQSGRRQTQVVRHRCGCEERVRSFRWRQVGRFEYPVFASS